MTVVDKILGWLMVAFGVAHGLATFAVHHAVNMGAVWFFGTGVAMIAIGMLNLIRADKSDAFIRVCCVMANSLLLAICVALAWSLGRAVIHNVQVLAVGTITLLELIFSAGK